MLAGYVLVLLCAVATALPSIQIANHNNAVLGVQWPGRRRNSVQTDDLPLLKLGYQTYRATRYNSKSKIYTFKNIRYAAPPVGPLRWAMPAPPAPNSTVSNGEYGPMCVQPANDGALTRKKTTASEGEATNKTEPAMGEEDCLFLDLYVPQAALDNPTNTRMPVIVWLFGGGYFMGNKDSSSMGQFFLGEKVVDHSVFDYDGSPIIEAANGKAIFVAGNYRLGAFGFMTGSTMEKEALPNAGLFDQRAIFQWVQDNIHLVGGDKTEVSAWGESAGGGSIINHLVLKGGKMDPLFSKAVIQSGAHPLIWDRRGMLEERYKIFEKHAGCENKGVECLRAASSETLRLANTLADREAPKRGHLYSPAPDGNYIRQIAPLEFRQGNYWKGLKSLIVSHVEDEAIIFVPSEMSTETDFMEYLRSLFPGYLRTSDQLNTVANFYPLVNLTGRGPRLSNQGERAKLFIRDSTFTCQDRWLAEAYENKTWAMKYSVSPGLHSMDLLATFQKTQIVPSFPAYKSYLASHALTGDPNSLSMKGRFFQANKIPWPKVDTSGEPMRNVLGVNIRSFRIVEDNQDSKSKCDFWRDFLGNGTKIGKYDMPALP